MKILLYHFTILSVLFCNEVKSSEADTVWYNSEWEITSKERADFFRIASFDLNSGCFTGNIEDYYMNGSIEMTGYYKTGLKDGAFIFYYENGSIMLSAKFENNKRTGYWIYYSEDEKVTKEIIYSEGNEKLMTFIDKKGKVLVKDGTGKFHEQRKDEFSTFIIKGKVKNGLKDKVWKQFRDQRIIYHEKYKDTKFVEGYSYLYSSINKEFPILEYDEVIPELLKKEDIQFERGVKMEMNEIAEYFYNRILNDRGLEENSNIINSKSELTDFFDESIIYNQDEVDNNYYEIITITFELNANREIVHYSFPESVLPEGLKQELIRIIKSIKKLNIQADNNKIEFQYQL